tara:strand:+ start:1225 stop:1470 length:246 start_codon:yes stop_codon:yes gene_type:complete
MNKKKNIDQIRNLLEKTFPNSKVPKSIQNLKIGDLKDWDSLGNFNLLLTIEDFYNFKFELDEISNIQSIKKILEVLKNKNF